MSLNSEVISKNDNGICSSGNGGDRRCQRRRILETWPAPLPGARLRPTFSPSLCGWFRSYVSWSSLLHSGATGHCNTCQVLKITAADNSEHDSGVARDVHIEKSIIIDKSPRALIAFGGI